MKKAQIQAQIFIYILILIVAGGILIYGYNAIQGFRKQADNVLYLQFENDLKHDLQTISYQSTKLKTYNLPSFGEKVCFSRGPGRTIIQDVDAEGNYPLIRSAVLNNVQENVFIYPSGERSFFTGVEIALGSKFIQGSAGQIEVPVNFKCFDVLDGVLKIKITGQGNFVLILE